MPNNTQISILVVDDDLDREDCAEDPMTALAWVSAKHGRYSFNRAHVREKLDAYGGPALIHAAYTPDQACDMLVKTPYTIVFLDGGFDTVMDAIADAQGSETCPKYLVPISASPERNCNMYSKLAVLPTTKRISRDFAKQLGIYELI